MPPSRILDSHIHLWPSTATESTHHAWMTPPGHQLAKRHGIKEYKAAIATSDNSNNATSPSSSSTSISTSFIYVETDRYLPTSTPAIPESSSEDEKTRELIKWANQPLEELKFLRRIVENTPSPSSSSSSGDDGFSPADNDGKMMKGAVIWAPFHLSPALFTAYVRIAEQVAGPALWERVVGFRYLLQGKGEGEVKALVQSEDWLENLVSIGRGRGGRGGRGWAFDVGVDVHRDGVGGLECVVGMVEEVRRREGGRDGGGGGGGSGSGGGNGQGGSVTFVLNHLCKPPLPLTSTTSTSTFFPRWRAALTRLSTDPAVYMKLSGLFNEFTSPGVPNTTSPLLSAVRPFFDVALTCFPGRLLFGSDWPVCNVGGPRGELGNWVFWVEVVEAWMDGRGMGEEEREGVWWRAGGRAYGVEM